MKSLLHLVYRLESIEHMFVSSKRINRCSGMSSFSLDGEPLEWFSHRGTSESTWHMLHHKVAGTYRAEKPCAQAISSWLVDLLHNREILIAHISLFWSCLVYVKFTFWSVRLVHGSADVTVSSQSQTPGKCVSHIKSMNDMQSTQQTSVLCLRIGNPVAMNADIWRQRRCWFHFCCSLSPSAECSTIFPCALAANAWMGATSSVSERSHNVCDSSISAT